MDPSPPKLPAGRRLSHFEVLRAIGQGAMGTVYLAKDLTLQRQVALKVVEPGTFSLAGSRERFLHEARSAARFSHPNIVSVFEFGEEGGQLFLAMEYVEGETLDHLLSKVKRFTPRDCVALLMQAVAGLSHACKAGTIHRDVKPANLILGSDGRLRLLDFGLARAVDQPSLTTAGLVLGTPDYMSPEQAMGEKVDYTTDIFSLGVVLYELLSGELPFPGNSTFEVLRRRTEEAPPPIAKLVHGLPPALVRAVERCLARMAYQRYPSYDALGADLLEAISVLPDRTVLPLAAQLTSSQVTSLASLRAGMSAALEEEPPATAAELPPRRFPAWDGPRIMHLPRFLFQPWESISGMVGHGDPSPAEALRVYGEVLVATWLAGILLAGRLWPTPGPVEGLAMVVVFGASLKAANMAQAGTLSLFDAATVGAWCAAPSIFTALAPAVSALCCVAYLVLAMRMAAMSDAAGVGPRRAAPATDPSLLESGQTRIGVAPSRPKGSPKGSPN